MARRIRLDAPRVAHHVMVRGLDGAHIFRSPDDHQDFVGRLVRLMPECDARCLAWALIPNHVHLVVQTQRGDLSRVMRRLNTGYAVRFNRVYERRGYVFQNRFRSRIVTGDADLMGLIRYVHLNPVEAGLVTSVDALGAFPWSGHGALVGRRPALEFEAVREALALFGEDQAQARAGLLAWMRRDDGTGMRADESACASEATGWARGGFEPEGRVGLESVLAAACVRYELRRDELCSGSKLPRIARARAAVAWVAVVELGVSGRSMAASLGVTPSTVSSALARGRRIALADGFRASELDAPSSKDRTIRNI